MLPAQLICIGLNHRTAPVALRERLSGAAETLYGSCRSDLDASAVEEFALLSTCNRVELYAIADEAYADGCEAALALLAGAAGIDRGDIAAHAYYLTGWDALEHLHRVAAGLDSLVLGEPQILGQVVDALEAATETCSAGLYLKPLFRSAIRAGKRSRAETAISRRPASISSISVALAEEMVGTLHDRQVLVIGLGEMGRLSLKILQERGVSSICVANRSREKAEFLASRHGYRAYGLDDLVTAVAAADVVISTTAAPDLILDRDMAAAAMERRPHRGLVIIDIAVPRDVEPSVGHLVGITLYDMNDLHAELDASLKARQQEIPAVEAVIDEEMKVLQSEYQEMITVPLIRDLRLRAEAIRDQEVQRTLGFLGEVDPETARHIQHLSRALVNKLLHQPTIRLKEQARNGHSDGYIAAFRDLFDLPERPQEPSWRQQ